MMRGVPTTLDFDDELARQVEAVYATPDVAATRIAVFRAMGVPPVSTCSTSAVARATSPATSPWRWVTGVG